METIVFIILQIFFTTRAVLKIGEYSRLFPSFSWGMFGHVTRLDQSGVSKKIWWIIISNMQQVYMCNVFGELTGIVNKRIPFLGMNILKISFQYSTYTAKETPFRSEIMRYNDLEQTNTLFLRENRNQNASKNSIWRLNLLRCERSLEEISPAPQASNFANAICIHVAWIN